jgi:hypothetical protein
MDANVLMKSVLIGSYVFDAARIYYQRDHEMYRKWVALINDDDPECTGVQGAPPPPPTPLPALTPPPQGM